MFTKGKEQPHGDEPLQQKTDFQPGKAYMLIGGTEEDIETKCPSCGAPFTGPCQSACGNCTTVRKAYYVDVTDVKLKDTPGKAQTFDRATSLVLPNQDEIEIGDYSHMAEAVGGAVSMGYACSAKLVVARNINAGQYARITTVVVSDGGTALFGYNAVIETLVAGKDSKLNFAADTQVKNLLTMGGVSIKAKSNFKQNNRKNTSYAEVARLIATELNS